MTSGKWKQNNNNNKKLLKKVTLKLLQWSQCIWMSQCKCAPRACFFSVKVMAILLDRYSWCIHINDGKVKQIQLIGMHITTPLRKGFAERQECVKEKTQKNENKNNRKHTTQQHQLQAQIYCEIVNVTINTIFTPPPPEHLHKAITLKNSSKP